MPIVAATDTERISQLETRVSEQTARIDALAELLKSWASAG